MIHCTTYYRYVTSYPDYRLIVSKHGVSIFLSNQMNPKHHCRTVQAVIYSM